MVTARRKNRFTRQRRDSEPATKARKSRSGSTRTRDAREADASRTASRGFVNGPLRRETALAQSMAERMAWDAVDARGARIRSQPKTTTRTRGKLKSA